MEVLRYLSLDWIDALTAEVAASDSLRDLAAATDVGITQVVTDGPEGDVVYHLQLGAGSASFGPGAAHPEHVRFTQDWSTAVAVATGAMNAQDAFIKGRILLTGDQQKLVASAPVFKAARLGVRLGAGPHLLRVRAAVPELPEVQAHAERLSAAFAGTPLRRFVPITFTALKTAVPPPDSAYGQPLIEVGRRGKYLLLRFAPTTFVIHLMQGGRLLVDDKQSAKPRNGQARLLFEDGRALLLTEAGKERRAGVWCVPADAEATTLPLAKLGPEADSADLGRTPRPIRRVPHAAPRFPARPARRGRAGSAVGQRGLPPGPAVTVRQHQTARAR